MINREESGGGGYYLYVGENQLAPANVFFWVAEEWIARELCLLFADEYAAANGHVFQYGYVSDDALGTAVRLDESLSCLGFYDDPDPGIYESPPSPFLLLRAEYSRRASVWHDLLTKRTNASHTGGNTPIGETASVSADDTLEVAMEKVRRLLEKHRLTFLYFAVPRRQNPLNLKEQWETLQTREFPTIPAEAIDADGEFLFSHRRTLEALAQSAVAKFGTCEGNKPRVINKSGEVVDVEGGSFPYWVVDEGACLYLEDSVEKVLDACRQLIRRHRDKPSLRLVQKVKGVLRDEGKAKWYASNLVGWAYLMRLDEAIESLKLAEFDGDSDATASDDDVSGCGDPKTQKVDAFPELDEIPAMSDEQSRNSALILLSMLAQAYYKMLEATVSMAGWVTALDLELNHSYLWTIQSLKNLLKNHKHLRDYPGEFEPVLPDLYPSTIADLEWSDMVAPDVEEFLVTVQKYTIDKGVDDPEEGSPAWVMIEMFRPSIIHAIQCAENYNKRMRTAQRKILGEPAETAQEESSPSPKTENISTTIFPTPQGSTWADLSIRFLDGETVSVRIGEDLWRYSFVELGMADGRNKRPTKQWDLLRTFGRHQGVVTWETPGADRRIKKRKQTLANELKRFFRLEGEPIVSTPDKKGWRTVFSVSDS